MASGNLSFPSLSLSLPRLLSIIPRRGRLRFLFVFLLLLLLRLLVLLRRWCDNGDDNIRIKRIVTHTAVRQRGTRESEISVTHRHSHSRSGNAKVKVVCVCDTVPKRWHKRKDKKRKVDNLFIMMRVKTSQERQSWSVGRSDGRLLASLWTLSINKKLRQSVSQSTDWLTRSADCSVLTQVDRVGLELRICQWHFITFCSGREGLFLPTTTTTNNNKKSRAGEKCLKLDEPREWRTNEGSTLNLSSQLQLLSSC